MFTWTCERVRLPIYSTELIKNNQRHNHLFVSKEEDIPNLFTLIPEEIEQITLENHVVMCVKLTCTKPRLGTWKDRRGWTFKVYLA